MEAVAAYLMCVYLSERDDASIICKICQVRYRLHSSCLSCITSCCVFLTFVVQLLDEHMVEFTQYERNLVPLGYFMPSATSSAFYDHRSLTPTIDKIVELSTGAIKGTSSVQLASMESMSMDISDFECSLCTGIVYEPVTVTCGHSFCCSCLRRAFDHSYTCPVCRAVLQEVCLLCEQITCFRGK